MLVLSRFRQESIMVGDDVQVMVVDVRGDQVRIGISAPVEVPVHRLEVYDAIARERGAPPVRSASRHCDSHHAMREALRTVVARLAGDGRGGFAGEFTAAEVGRLVAAAAGGGGS